MADIELVIKISEKIYNAVTHKEFDASLVVNELKKSIADGTPLPKYHGDLIDRDALIYEQTHHCGYLTPFNLIDEDNLKNALTIIKANNKGEE